MTVAAWGVPNTSKRGKNNGGPQVGYRHPAHFSAMFDFARCCEALGTPRREAAGVMCHPAHLWAHFDFPGFEALGIPQAAAVM